MTFTSDWTIRCSKDIWKPVYVPSVYAKSKHMIFFDEAPSQLEQPSQPVISQKCPAASFSNYTIHLHSAYNPCASHLICGRNQIQGKDHAKRKRLDAHQRLCGAHTVVLAILNFRPSVSIVSSRSNKIKDSRAI